MTGKTRQNLEKLFVNESVGAARTRIFALKAEKEGYTHIARLFSAIQESRSVKAQRFLRLLRGTIGSTEENLREVFENDGRKEMFAFCGTEAEKEGEKIIEHTFGQTLAVEKNISALYGRAGKEDEISYFVCGICGHIQTDEAPDNCPVCNAVKSKFRKI